MSDATQTPTLPADMETAPAPGRGAAVGRFLVLGSLGAGGMGVVLSAYEPQLDRRVALKLVRGDVWPQDQAAAGRESLLGEAQAMARLNHPNVVAVYEVILEGDGGYVVMEQVAGQTLRAWLSEKERGWREIVDVVIQAGVGLAAAHRAGVVHRDFKPDNVLVGDDGRPRVSDFGLALAKVAPGAGTRAYMAPEQLAGAPSDARADQYAFCVTMWEAVYGERPQERLGTPRDKRVPPWLRRAVERGLAKRPEDRFPTMDALLAALRPPRRLRMAAAAAMAIAALVGGGFILGRQGAMPACAGAEARVAQLWAGATRERVADAFRKIGRPYGDDTFARVDSSLRQRLSDWAAAHRDACEATHVRHEQSEAMLDLRMHCLGRARAEIGELVSLLAHADVGALNRAAQAAAAVGDIGPCADVESLAAVAPLPRDPRAAQEVEGLRQEVAHLAALRHLGKWKEGLQAGRDLVVRARRSGYAPILASALEITGWLELDAGDDDAAIDMLYEAARVALVARDDGVLARAMTTLVLALGGRKQRFDAAEVAYRVAAAAIERAGNSPRLLQQLFQYRGSSLQLKGEYEAALALRQLVLALQERTLGPDRFEVAITLLQIADTMDKLGRGPQALPIGQRAIAIAEKALGPEHPTLAALLQNFGMLHNNLREFDTAAPLLERALALAEKSLGPDDPLVAATAHNLGGARYGQRRLPEARLLLERAIRIFETKYGPDHPSAGASYGLLATIVQLEGRLDEAHRLFEKALAIKGKAYGQNHPSLAVTYRADGDVLLALGRLADARRSVEDAMAIEKKTVGEDHPDHGESLRLLGDVLRAERRFAEAVPVYRRALALLEKSYGSDSEYLVEPLVGLSDALVEVRDADAALTAAERAVAVTRKAPVDVEARAAFHLARAQWVSGRDRPRAMALARAARARLAALPYPSEELPRIERWLANVATP